MAKAMQSAMTPAQRSAAGKAGAKATARFFATRAVALSTIPDAPRGRKDFNAYFAALPEAKRREIEALAEKALAEKSRCGP